MRALLQADARALLLAGGCVLLGLAVVALCETVGYGAAALLPAAVAGGALLVSNPFWPLVLLVVFVPADALANRLFSPLPVSASALLTAATVGAILLARPTAPRSAVPPLRDPVVYWTGAFAVVAILSTFFADQRDLANDAMGRLAGMMMIVLLTMYVVDTPRKLRIVVLALVGATLFNAVVVIADTALHVRLLSNAEAAVTAEWEGISRSSGASDYNPTTAAIITAAGVLMAVPLAIEWRRFRLFTLAAAGLGAVAVILSYARSASLALMVVGLMIAWRHRKSRFMPLAVILSVIAGVAMLPLIPDAYWARLATLTNFDADYTLWRRVSYNLIGLDLVAKDPLLGVGPGNFPYHFMDDDYRYMPGRTLDARRLHNMYLGVAAEYGLLGLVAFTALIGTGLLRLKRALRDRLDPDAAAFTAAIFYAYVGYLLASLFMPHQYVKYTWVLAGLAAAQSRMLFLSLHPPTTPPTKTTTRE